MEKNAKIYIAGHNGLVGSAIVKSLTARGYSNFVYRELGELDLRDGQAVSQFFEHEKPDYVFLAAAKVGGIIANNTYRADFIYENLMIQNNVIHQAYQNGVKKLLFLGSTCIYPCQAPQPMPEDCLLTDTLEYTNEPYAIAKIAGIKMCESYNLQYGTNFLAVMPTNLYGPNDNFDLEKSHVLPALIRKAHLAKALEDGNWDFIRNDLNRLPIGAISGKQSEEDILAKLASFGILKQDGRVKMEIWGSGKPMREFLWSEEMADACVYVMEQVEFEDVKPQDSKEVRNTHINIGTGKEISIGGLAELVKKTVGFTGDLFFNTEKPDGTMRKLTDPSKIHQLGWKHQIEIEEGVKKLSEWYINK